jgi:phenylalanyl-tRNA synthetase beta chain
MRTTLLGSLLDSLRRNTSRGFEDVRLFEYGAVYLPRSVAADAGDTANPWYPRADGELPIERTHIGALMTGTVRTASWGDPEPPRTDYFAAKGVLEALIRALRAEWSVKPSSGKPFLHPRRGADVIVSEQPAGWLGEIHPSVAAQWDLEGVAGFELDYAMLASAATAVPRYEDLTSFPAVRQDIAVVVADDVPAARVLELIRTTGGALLRGAEVFDVYRGAQVGEGRASLAIRLEFRAPDRTLTDDEVAQRREQIVVALRERVGAELRG